MPLTSIFIIFLEIVRAVVNYVREQRVTMSLLVDAFIILALREFIVNVVKINKEELNNIDALFSNAINYNLLILLGFLFLFFTCLWLSLFPSVNHFCWVACDAWGSTADAIDRASNRPWHTWGSPG